jgi:hypothetical protein
LWRHHFARELSARTPFWVQHCVANIKFFLVDTSTAIGIRRNKLFLGLQAAVLGSALEARDPRENYPLLSPLWQAVDLE